MDDHEVCTAVRAGREVTHFRDVQRVWERGLVDLALSLTVKGAQLLDGIEPKAADWQAEMRRRMKRSAKTRRRKACAPVAALDDGDA